MTFARTVRLFALLVAVGAFGWQYSLQAQVPYDAGQYVPASGADPSYPDDYGDWQTGAYVSAVDGTARLSRAGDTVRDFEQVPLEVGDQLSTTRGRVEVLYSDGSVVALDEYTDVTIDAQGAWRLLNGRIKVVLRSGGLDIDAPPAGFTALRTPGTYRITMAANRAGAPEVELAVTQGSAELENSLGRTLVRAGTRALTTASFAPSVPYAFATPRDDFERWTEALEANRYGVESPRYLPVELRAYGGLFDRYGYWGQYGSYGWVWYPRVAVGWQPFRSGRWSFVVNFGYNWVGGLRWEWPTYYYGRWDRVGSRWFWIPQRPLTRRVGYAVPRRSYNISVAYYQRPGPSRPVTMRHAAGTQVGRPVSGARRPVEVLRGSGQSGRAGSGSVRPGTPERRAVPRTQTTPIRPGPTVNRQTQSSRPGVTAPARSQSPSRGSAAPGTRPGSPSRQPSAVQRPSSPTTRQTAPSQTRRTPTLQSRQGPTVTRQAPSAGRQSSRPSPNVSRQGPSRQAPPATRQAPSSNRATPSTRQAPPPQRSSPSARPPSRPAPQTGSRTPSGRSSARPSGGSSSRSGSAVRRGRGGGI